jgi:FHA domain
MSRGSHSAPAPGEGLLRSLGSVKLIAERACIRRLGDDERLLHQTAYVVPPGALVGRAPHADVRLDLPDVSWEHCAIQPMGVDWTVVPKRSRTGVRVVAGRREPLLLPIGFPWLLVDGVALLVGETRLVVEVNRPDSVGATTAAASHASEILPSDLFETALALTAPYRENPPRHAFAPVRELVARLNGVTSAKGVYLRLERLERYGSVARELHQRRETENAGLPSALPGSKNRYAELAAAVVAAYPGFGWPDLG